MRSADIPSRGRSSATPQEADLPAGDHHVSDRAGPGLLEHLEVKGSRTQASRASLVSSLDGGRRSTN